MRDIDGITCNYRHYSLLFVSLALSASSLADNIIYRILSPRSCVCFVGIGVEEHAPIQNIVIKKATTTKIKRNLWAEEKKIFLKHIEPSWAIDFFFVPEPFIVAHETINNDRPQNNKSA